MRIKKMILQQFKAVQSAEYDFSGTRVDITGENGAGKTTLADAFYWVMCNKDYELNDNPNIRPNFMEESLPRVEIVLDINGVEIVLYKQQKQKKSGNTIALTNAYEINGVPKTEKDFKAYLQEKGIDVDSMLIYSHPEIFIKDIENKKVRDDRRNMLFGMVADITDYDVAMQIEEAGTVASLLKDYTAEEIQAMQNATLRKITEVYGKHGEVIDNQIIGKESAKVEIDVAELELAKNGLLKIISDIEDKQNDFKKIVEEKEQANKELMNVTFEMNDIQRKAHEEDMKKRADADNALREVEQAKRETESKIQSVEMLISSDEKKIEVWQQDIEKARAGYKAEKSREFDETSLVCPYCKQEYPQDKKDELKADFEQNKARVIKVITDKGNELKQKIDLLTKNINENKEELTNLKFKLSVDTEICEAATKEIGEYKPVNVMDIPEYKALADKKAEMEKALNEQNTADSEIVALSRQKREAEYELVNIEKQIALSENNSRIDEQIEELEAKKLEMEQKKADAERVLYQLSLVQQKKNEMLSDAVNKNFELVQFKLFEYQKNGEVKDACTPTIDGKTFVESNGALRTLAKLDIAKGLQKFYKVDFPIWLDEAEHLTEVTWNKVNMTSQFITMACTEDKKLKVEVK